ncbi:unnamed protein product [Brassicogethes aeneus]|uniref:Uncharacterized protein n=1 Tax=Brassicogethes aeneus TaxID=1431903 RepID=A0A9P0FIR1_BRAAE|nr:unnamed protein product [Brassicogethes aeneus]
MNLYRPCNKYSIICLISFLLIFLGIFLISSWSFLYDQITRSSMTLTPTSMAFDIWKKNPVPMKIDFYFYNWTNPQDIHNVTVKPKFVELGPYRFIETKEKSNITWNANNNTVTFNHVKKWYFDPENSPRSLFDEITTLNPTTVSASYAARDWSYFVKKGLSVALKSMASKIHITKTVGELLFEGYEDPLLNMARNMPFLAGSSMPPMDKFGWFYGRNGSETYEGTFNMDTGVDGSLGRLYRWKGMNHTDFYKDECSDVGGSAGEFFPPNMNKETIIKFFSADLCRTMELEFQKEMELHNMAAYKFSAGDRFLDNGTKFAANKCYCMGDCMPSGAVNVSACRYGSPAFVSLPHFHKADSYYQDCIEGVTSEDSKHDFYMVFEPTTGIPLEVAARLQLNLLIHPINSIEMFETVPKVYFPVMWFEQVVKMPDSMALQIRLLLNFQVICCSAGITLIFAGLLVQFCFCYKLCSAKFCKKKCKNEDIVIKERVPLTDGNYRL